MTIPALKELLNSLKRIDSDLRENSIYRTIYVNIQDLLKKRDFQICLLKRQLKGFLIARKENAKAHLMSAERPEGVLIQYKMLLDNALRNQANLDKLEDEQRFISLEKARSEDPWKLISKPTLFPFPVAPSSRRIVTLGLISGFFVGCV